MPIYKVEQYELRLTSYHVEADSEAEAIAKRFAGEGLEQRQEFVETAGEYGMSTKQHSELAKQLQALGIQGIGDEIPSIYAVRKL